MMSSNLKTFLRLSVGTFLLLLLIKIALPAMFLLLRVPSFEIGTEPFWLIRWNNTTDGSGVQFNVLPLIAIAILTGLLGLLIKRR
ncbi:MAG: hypothetical protein HC936_18300 [Leptolyngbyaceae cyanobacterium SU_3_3]|nr:hypothetical protein [Leptolyngbyaceae cyanobacterium SU_3_3]NJR49659.1 hypothetical protein [Leptolyngbyaceae cyanobacterium CSU_1_3]